MKINNGNKERKPNKWQLFLQDCRPRQSNNLSMTEKVVSCGVQYRELKEKNPKKLDEIITRVQSIQLNNPINNNPINNQIKLNKTIK